MNETLTRQQSCYKYIVSTYIIEQFLLCMIYLLNKIQNHAKTDSREEDHVSYIDTDNRVHDQANFLLP